jgi:hypothetical protein
MRAKEYIEIHKSKLEFAEQVTAILEHCTDLRTNLSKTIKFYDCYLSTFENLQRFLTNSRVSKIKKESYWKLLHEELQPAIKNDKSYTYLYQRMLQEKDLLSTLVSADEIKDCICQQFEDYPKQFIDDFVCTEPNKDYYENICDIFSTSEDILNVFNTAYEIFDNIRVKMHKPIQASFYFKEYPYKSERHKYFILPLVASYLNNYDYDLTDSQRKNRQKVSEELSKYIAQSIDPQSEAVKAKSYWYFFQNSLKAAVGDNEKIKLLITKQTEFNQMPEIERQSLGAEFGRNCQLEIDKIRQLQALNVSAEEDTAEKDSGQIAPVKVRSVVLLELLKKMQLGTAQNDLTKICKLIAFVTGNSYNNIYNEMQKGIFFGKSHGKYIEEANKLLSDINASISINKDKQY